MLKRACLISSIALLPVLGAGPAWAQSNYPAAVQNRIDEMTTMCSGIGTPLNSPDLVTVVDVTGDGVPDYILDEAAFNCDGGASLFSSSGGASVSVFIGTPAGGAFKAFEHGAFAVKLDQRARPARVYLAVAGPLCGQHVTRDMSHADYKGCLRPLRWDADARTMDFAPVSEIMPVDYLK